MPNKKIIVLGKEINLTDKHYKAQGGEGVIYVKDNAVFKIYHDPAKAIPLQKINELQVLSELKNVVIPSSPIYDTTGKHIGHVMRYIDQTEYLCKLFVSTFKINNSIFQSDIVDIINNMQRTLVEIHKRGIIVGDYNEMNFLIDKTFKIPYHIDVDSYQTPSFKCNVIMQSVRDRSLPMGVFNELTDWFSWGIVVHQLYTGIHPYKGSHPDYKMNDFDGRMGNNISVYNKDVKVPRFVDLDNIPTPHKDWFIKVFERGERCIPPYADATKITQVMKKVFLDIQSGIIAEYVRDYDGRIITVNISNGITTVVTDSGVYQNSIKVIDFAIKIKRAHVMTNVYGGLFIAIKVGNEVRFYDTDKNVVVSIEATDFVSANDCIYTIGENGVIQHTIETFGSKHKIIPTQVATCFLQSSEVYDGVIIQDIYGKIVLTIPYEKSKVSNIRIAELTGYRIIDAKRCGRFFMCIGEKNGSFDRITIFFNQTFEDYESCIETGGDNRDVNFIVKQNGMCVNVKNDSDVELFYDFTRGSKVINNTPIEIDYRLYESNNTIYFTNDNKLYIVGSK